MLNAISGYIGGLFEPPTEASVPDPAELIETIDPSSYYIPALDASDSLFDPVYLFHNICDHSQVRHQYSILHIIWYQTFLLPQESDEDQFIVAHLSNSRFLLIRPQALASRESRYLRPTRAPASAYEHLLGPDGDPEVFFDQETSTPSSSSANPAQELVIHCLNACQLRHYFNGSRAKIFLQVKLRDCRALEFARLLTLVAERSQAYKFKGPLMSYWCAFTLWLLAKVYFEKGPKPPGIFKRLAVPKNDDDWDVTRETLEIFKEYILARDADPNPIGFEMTPSQRLRPFREREEQEKLDVSPKEELKGDLKGLDESEPLTREFNAGREKGEDGEQQSTPEGESRT